MYNLSEAGGTSDAPPAPERIAGPLMRAAPAPSYRWLRAGVELYVAGARELLREPMTLAMMAAVPLLFIVLYGIVFRGSGGPSINLGVASAPGSVVARSVERQLHAVPGLTVQHGTSAALLASMRRGNLDGVVTLPSTLDSALHGGQASLTVTYDPAHQNMAAIVQSLAAQVADRVDRNITHRRQALFVRAAPLDGRVLDQFSYALPGIVALAIIQVGLMGTTMPLIQSRQSGVLRRLGTTPLRRSVLAASQIALRVTLALVQVVGLILLGHFALGVAMVGNWVVVLLIAALGSLVMIAFGYLLASRARSTEGGNGLITAVFMPLLFLSGLFFPLELAPSWMKSISTLVPATYLGDALRQVMVGATPRFSLTLDLAAMAGFLAVLAATAVRLFAWE